MNGISQIEFETIIFKNPPPVKIDEQVCSDDINTKMKPELTCAGCFKYIESMDEFTQITNSPTQR